MPKIDFELCLKEHAGSNLCSPTGLRTPWPVSLVSYLLLLTFDGCDLIRGTSVPIKSGHQIRAEMKQIIVLKQLGNDGKSELQMMNAASIKVQMNITFMQERSLVQFWVGNGGRSSGSHIKKGNWIAPLHQSWVASPPTPPNSTFTASGSNIHWHASLIVEQNNRGVLNRQPESTVRQEITSQRPKSMHHPSVQKDFSLLN